MAVSVSAGVSADETAALPIRERMSLLELRGRRWLRRAVLVAIHTMGADAIGPSCATAVEDFKVKGSRVLYITGTPLHVSR